jgi:hypothetical protein
MLLCILEDEILHSKSDLLLMEKRTYLMLILVCTFNKYMHEEISVKPMRLYSIR